MELFLENLSLWVALVSAVTLGVSWFAYPAVRMIQGRALDPDLGNDPGPGAKVAVVIATRDEPEWVEKKVENLLGLPDADLLSSIVIAVDGKGPWKVGDYPVFHEEPRVRLVQGGLEGGKATALNAAVDASPPSDYLLILDTSQTLTPGSIGALVSSTEEWGWTGASGVVRPDRGGGLGRIWQVFELGIRAGQATSRGLVTTSGAISLLRREAWIPLPVGTICDDLFLTMGVARAGGRIGLCRGAVAVDSRSIPPRLGYQKKVRTLTGLWQFILTLEPSPLNPNRNPLWVDFVFHKVMRLATPFFAVLGALGVLFYLSLTDLVGWKALTGALVGVCIILAISLSLNRSLRWRVATFASPVVATWNGIRRDWNVWDRPEAND